MEAVVSSGADAASTTLQDAGLAELEAIAAPGQDLARRDSLRRRLLAAADLGALLLAFGSVSVAAAPNLSVQALLVSAVGLLGWILLNKLLGLYDRDAHLIHKSTLDELPRLALSAILGTTLIFMFAPPIADSTPDRGQTIAYMLLAFIWMFALRGLVRNAVVRRTPPERCLIIGSGAVAGMVARKLQLHPEYGVSVAGFVDVRSVDGNGNGNGKAFANGTGAPVPADLLGDLDDFEDICAAYNVDRVIIAFSLISHERLIDVIRSSKRLALKITVVPRLFEVIGHQVEVDQIEGITMLGLRGFGRTRSSLALKRAIDIGCAAVGLLLLAPVMVVIAVAVKLTSRGRVFYVHDRVGRGNQHFRMLKFRTMVEGADDLKPHLEHLNEADGPMFKIADDPRVTPLGRFLRKSSLDELPQLINVLRGDMSLVGPRPLIPSEDVHVIGYHRERLDLTPGLTGPWQVLGRTAIPFQEMIKLDYLYVAEWSLWNDIKLLLRTAPTVVQGRGQ
jgi:exopolysaccharide biosynthesis polyprenyl glycosylphosphotransferase